MRKIYEDELTDWLQENKGYWRVAGFMAFLLAPFIYVGITLWACREELQNTLDDALLLMQKKVHKREKTPLQKRNDSND